MIALMLCVTLLSCGAAKQDYRVASPNKKHELVFSLTEKGQPQYRFSSNGKAVIAPSLLGFEFIGLAKMTEGFKITGADKTTFDQSWQQPWGEVRTIRDHHNQLVVHLKESGGDQRLVDLVFRVFDDGMGFRYSFPKQPNLGKVKISNEVTQFNFPQDESVWWIPVHSENSYYESFYRKSPITKTDTINTPATFETKSGLYLALHEANLTDFASMTLARTDGTNYKSELVPWADGTKVYAEAPFETPWRTIIVGEKPGDLVTSTLMLNLNEPSKIKDVSWIRPSKYIGIWWGMHLEKYSWSQGAKHGATTENTKRYIDFAAANGFDGVLVEGWNIGWDGDWTADGRAFDFRKAYPDFDIEEIGRYGALKNVRLIGHHETAGAASHYESQLDDAFRLYNKVGVTTVKTGYVNKFLDKKEWHDGQFGVRHYRKVIETAAKYHIMIDNHEPVKGTGLQRTYPNYMSAEGARGQEYDAWSADGGNTPEHTTILPFTRLLSGPMDFTPGTFDLTYKHPSGARVQTTLAKQLALNVVMYSPLQMASDLPENYIGKPELQFIKDVPAIWSQTLVPDAKIGEYVVMARKDWDGNNWYVGAITNSDARKVSLKLDFLDQGSTYKAEIYSDGKDADWKTNPYPVDITSNTVDNTATMELWLAPGGGTAIRFVKQN